MPAMAIQSVSIINVLPLKGLEPTHLIAGKDNMPCSDWLDLLRKD